MKKIPTLFQRDEDRRYVTEEVTPGCEWVLAGEGVATRKFDGTCVMLDEVGNWWARREVKPGKAVPPGFVEVGYDETTGKTMGWEPVNASPFVKFWAEALGVGAYARSFTPGTYELIGPKVNGNPERQDVHKMIPHGVERLDLSDYLDEPEHLQRHVGNLPYEGIVWHHPDGRRAKLKARDIAGVCR